MPIVFRIDRELNLVVSTWSGQVEDAEAIEAYVSLFGDPGWSPGLGELTDLRNADLSRLTTRGLATIRDVGQRVGGSEHGTRTAVLASETMPVSLARMYERLAAEPSEVLRLFRDEAQAMRWVSASPVPPPG